jgi:hypothetical protein
LVARFVRIEEVRGSIPLSSTTPRSLEYATAAICKPHLKLACIRA